MHNSGLPPPPPLFSMPPGGKGGASLRKQALVNTAAASSSANFGLEALAEEAENAAGRSASVGRSGGSKQPSTSQAVELPSWSAYWDKKEVLDMPSRCFPARMHAYTHLALHNTLPADRCCMVDTRVRVVALV